jgi:hypothetical protein
MMTTPKFIQLHRANDNAPMYFHLTGNYVIGESSVHNQTIINTGQEQYYVIETIEVVLKKFKGE